MGTRPRSKLRLKRKMHRCQKCGALTRRRTRCKRCTAVLPKA